MTDKTLIDLKWFHETLRKGGRTSEFYEVQAPIIAKVLKKEEWEKDRDDVRNISSNQ